MNETLQNAAADAIKKAIIALENGSEWLSGQIPDLIQQYLMYNLLYNLIWFFVWFIVFSSTIYLSYRWRNSVEFQKGFFVISIFFFLISFLEMLICGFDALKIWIAPKVFLLEWAASLVK